MTENDVPLLNGLIKNLPDTNNISDGYHTFGELYEHRIVLFIAVCRAHYGGILPIWKSKKHSDGSEWDGWFLLGIGIDAGEQITYHLPISKWNECDFDELEIAPPFDGHTPQDVLQRLQSL